MKKIILFIVSILIFTQCRDNNGDFELLYTVEFEIPAGIPAFPFQNVEVEVPNFNIEQRFSSAGFMVDEVTRINARSIRLDALTGSADFSFLQRAILEIRNPEDVNDKREIAFLEFVPNNQGNTLDLIPSLPDVAEYLKAGNFILTFKMDPRFSPAQVMQVRMNLSFDAFAE